MTTESSRCPLIQSYALIIERVILLGRQVIGFWLQRSECLYQKACFRFEVMPFTPHMKSIDGVPPPCVRIVVIP